MKNFFSLLAALAALSFAAFATVGCNNDPSATEDPNAVPGAQPGQETVEDDPSGNMKAQPTEPSTD